ncbi:hypothetical protein SQ11_01625 [Nitrosospira sp. NpAV]|nr:hypothetical protein SQ11_01625 [Nitrosospira sp. NpAV]
MSSRLLDLKEIGLQKVSAGPYFTAFSANRMLINLQNLSSPRFFCWILQFRQAESVAAAFHV